MGNCTTGQYNITNVNSKKKSEGKKVKTQAQV